MASHTTNPMVQATSIGFRTRSMRSAVRYELPHASATPSISASGRCSSAMRTPAIMPSSSCQKPVKANHRAMPMATKTATINAPSCTIHRLRTQISTVPAMHA